MKFSKQIVLMIFLLILTGCVHQPVGRPLRLAYLTEASIPLNVTSIRLEKCYELRMKPPYVEHYLPLSPYNFINQWLNERFKPMGKQSICDVQITEAWIREEGQPSQGLKSWLRGIIKDSTDGCCYRGRLEVKIKLIPGSAAGRPLVLRINAKRPRKKDLSVLEQRYVIEELMEDMMHHLDKSVLINLKKYFPGLIISHKGV